MIRIRTRTDVASITDPDLRRLIELRLLQLSAGEPYDPDRHGEIFVVQPHDALEKIERVVGFPITTNPIDDSGFGDADFTPACEVIDSHPTSYELVFAMNDIGLAVFIQKHPAVDSTLLSMCAAFAAPT